MASDEKQHHWVLPSTPHHTDGISTTYPHRNNGNNSDFHILDEDDDDTEIEVGGYQSFPFLVPDTPAVKRHHLSELFLPLPTNERPTSSSSAAVLSFVKDSFAKNRITSVLPSLSGVLSKVQHLQSVFCNSRVMQGLAEEAFATPGLSEAKSTDNHKPIPMAAKSYPSATTNANTKTVLKPICFYRSVQKDATNAASTLHYESYQNQKNIPRTKQQRSRLPKESSRTGRRHYPPPNSSSVKDAVAQNKSEILLELVPLGDPTLLLRTLKAPKKADTTADDDESKVVVVEDGLEFISRTESLLDSDQASDAVAMMMYRQHPPNDIENIPPPALSVLETIRDGKRHCKINHIKK